MGYLNFTADGVDYRLILVKDIFKKRNEPLEGLDALVLDSDLSSASDVEEIISGRDMLLSYKDQLKDLEIPIFSVSPERKKPEQTKFRFDLLVEYGHKYLPVLVGAVTLAKVGVDVYSLIMLYAIGVFNFLKNPMLGDEIIDTGTKRAYTNQATRMLKSTYDAIVQEPRVELINSISALKIKYGVIPNLIEKNPEEFEQRNPRVALIYGGKHRGLKECIQKDGRSKFSAYLHGFYGIPMFLDRDKILDIHEYRINPDSTVSHNIFEPVKPKAEAKLLLETES